MLGTDGRKGQNKNQEAVHSHLWKRTAASLEVGEERSDCGDTQIPEAAYWALLGGAGGRGGFLEALFQVWYIPGWGRGRAVGASRSSRGLTHARQAGGQSSNSAGNPEPSASFQTCPGLRTAGPSTKVRIEDDICRTLQSKSSINTLATFCPTF